MYEVGRERKKVTKIQERAIRKAREIIKGNSV